MASSMMLAISGKIGADFGGFPSPGTEKAKMRLGAICGIIKLWVGFVRVERF
jgi:hypothetical protein